MIIDIHTHIYDRKMYPKRFWEGLFEIKKRTLSDDEFKRWESATDGNVNNLIKDMDDAGIDISVCLTSDYAFLSQEEAEIPIWNANVLVAEAQQKYPDRIIGFAGVDPLRPGAVDLIEKGVKELGLKGVKFFPYLQNPNEQSIAPFMQKVADLGVPVLFHQGTDPLPFLAKYGDPRYLDDLLYRHPQLRITAAHCARGYEDLLVEMAIGRPKRLWTDLSGMQHEYVASPWHFLTRMRYMLDRMPNAVMIGSDWPFLKTIQSYPSHKGWIDVIKNLELPKAFLNMGMKQFNKEEKIKVLGENAKEFLMLA